MREYANGKAVTYPIATYRALQQMRRVAEYFRNQRNIAPTDEIRARYSSLLEAKSAEIREIERRAVA